MKLKFWKPPLKPSRALDVVKAFYELEDDEQTWFLWLVSGEYRGRRDRLSALSIVED